MSFEFGFMATLGQIAARLSIIFGVILMLGIGFYILVLIEKMILRWRRRKM